MGLAWEIITVWQKMKEKNVYLLLSELSKFPLLLRYFEN